MTLNLSKKIILYISIAVMIVIVFLTLLSQSSVFRPPKESPVLQNQKAEKIDKLEKVVQPLKNSNQSGKIALKSLTGGKTLVSLNTTNIATTGAQPVYLYSGTCQKPEKKLANLAALKNGSSESILNYSIKELTSTPTAILVQHSVREPFKYVACVEI